MRTVAPPLLALAALGCGPSPFGAAPEPPTRELADAGVTTSPEPRALVTTASGDVALVSTESGAPSLRVPSTAPVLDVATDPVNGRAFVLEGDETEGSGEIVSYTLGASPPTRRHTAWLDGVARLAATSVGVVLFEDGYGSRWKLLRDDGVETTAIVAPRPASAWTVERQGVISVEALGAGDEPGALVLESATVDHDALIGPVATPLSRRVGTDPPCARLLPAPAFSADLLVDVDHGALVVSTLRAGAEIATSPLAAVGPEARVEAAAALADGGLVAVLVSGVDMLVVARLDDQGHASGVGALGLGGHVRKEERFFSRDLAAVGRDRLLVATTAGIAAVAVSDTPAGIRLEHDARFDGAALRGPIQIVPR